MTACEELSACLNFPKRNRQKDSYWNVVGIFFLPTVYFLTRSFLKVWAVVQVNGKELPIQCRGMLCKFCTVQVHRTPCHCGCQTGVSHVQATWQLLELWLPIFRAQEIWFPSTFIHPVASCSSGAFFLVIFEQHLTAIAHNVQLALYLLWSALSWSHTCRCPAHLQTVHSHLKMDALARAKTGSSFVLKAYFRRGHRVTLIMMALQVTFLFSVYSFQQNKKCKRGFVRYGKYCSPFQKEASGLFFLKKLPSLQQCHATNKPHL